MGTRVFIYNIVWRSGRGRRFVIERKKKKREKNNTNNTCVCVGKAAQSVTSAGQIINEKKFYNYAFIRITVGSAPVSEESTDRCVEQTIADNNSSSLATIADRPAIISRFGDHFFLDGDPPPQLFPHFRTDRLSAVHKYDNNTTCYARDDFVGVIGKKKSILRRRYGQRSSYKDNLFVVCARTRSVIRLYVLSSSLNRKHRPLLSHTHIFTHLNNG